MSESSLQEAFFFHGWLRTSFIEYPGKIATVLFTSGCNLRCPYCHNPELVLKEPCLPRVSPEEVLKYLNKRRDLIDAVCITGGEPLLVAQDLLPFLQEVKKRGKLVKIDTNGSIPEAFTILNTSGLVDLWGIDFKLPFDQYHRVKGEKWSQKCLHVLEEALKDPDRLEIRTTLFPPFHDIKVLLEMARMLNNAHHWYWQNCRKEHTLSDECREITPLPPVQLNSWQDEINTKLGRELVIIRS